MHVTCPQCDTLFPLSAGFIAEDGKRLAALLAEFEPVLGRAAIAYLGLFKPPKTQLRLARATKLVAELQALVNAGTVARDERTGVRRPCTAALWALGIEQMLQQRSSLTLPLESHGYLRAVVFGLADKADAEAERQREETARSGRRAEPATSAGETPLQRELAWITQQEGYGLLTKDQAEAARAKARQTYPGGA